MVYGQYCRGQYCWSSQKPVPVHKEPTPSLTLFSGDQLSVTRFGSHCHQQNVEGILSYLEQNLIISFYPVRTSVSLRDLLEDSRDG